VHPPHCPRLVDHDLEGLKLPVRRQQLWKGDP
jgi:hypothetical protein